MAKKYRPSWTRRRDIAIVTGPVTLSVPLRLEVLAMKFAKLVEGDPNPKTLEEAADDALDELVDCGNRLARAYERLQSKPVPPVVHKLPPTLGG